MATLLKVKLLIKERGMLRSIFTKKCDELSSVDNNNYAVLLAQINDKYSRITELDLEIKTLIYDEKEDESILEERLLKEIEDSERYRDKWISINNKQEFGGKLIKDEVNVCKVNSNMKLPAIKLIQFDGNPKKWLSFWGQFEKLHLDANLDGNDKYHYLMQALDGKPKKMLEEFPATEEGYQEAIDHLKSRFGRKEELIELYIREMIGVVVNKQKEQRLAAIYDQLEGHLRALSTLGVGKDQFSAVLYPLVESCISSNTLIAWERSKASYVGNGEIDKLSKLMDFLRNEAESEERILRAQKGFKVEQSTSNKQTRVPTASDLFNQTRGKLISCIFCSKSNHNSQDCVAAQEFSLDKRKKLIVEKKSLFNLSKRWTFF